MDLNEKGICIYKLNFGKDKGDFSGSGDYNEGTSVRNNKESGIQI